MKFIFVRHTKPDIPEGICYGRSNIGLSNSFEDEKAAVLKKLQSMRYDSIYSSPLKRAASLAEAIHPNGNVIYDERLSEMDFGEWEMKPWVEIEKSIEAKRWFDNYVNVKTPAGESYQDLLDRVCEFIDFISSKRDSSYPLIICHRGVIGAFYTILNQLEPNKAFKLKVDYGDIIEIETKDQS